MLFVFTSATGIAWINVLEFSQICGLLSIRSLEDLKWSILTILSNKCLRNFGRDSWVVSCEDMKAVFWKSDQINWFDRLNCKLVITSIWFYVRVDFVKIGIAFKVNAKHRESKMSQSTAELAILECYFWLTSQSRCTQHLNSETSWNLFRKETQWWERKTNCRPELNSIDFTFVPIPRTNRFLISKNYTFTPYFHVFDH